MRKETNIDKKMVARAIIQKIEEENKPEKIRTDFLPGYDTPDKITLKTTNNNQPEIHKPDIEVVLDGKTNLYEIELDDKNKEDKWRLLSLFAKKNNGKFFLVVPDWMRQPMVDQLKNNKINASLIYFNTTA
ncbi:MAG: hypothetical protein ACOCXH_07905 [Cyclobacteriaceae bacterium]